MIFYGQPVHQSVLFCSADPALTPPITHCALQESTQPTTEAVVEWAHCLRTRMAEKKQPYFSLPACTANEDRILKAPITPPRLNQQPTAFIRPLCCLSSNPFGRKVALNTPLRHAASSTVACMFCACARCNKQVALHENKKWQNRVHWKTAHTVFCPSHTQRWFTSTLPITMVIKLAHNQAENPMAQTADSQPYLTSHLESEQTTSARLRKLQTQLNTPNRFVPDLVRVSPNASDVHRLGWCVPAFRRQNK